MERKPEWKTKEERIQDTPTIPTLSDQKKPPFPTAENKNISLLPAEKSQLPKSKKDPPPSCQKPCFIFPTAKITPFPTAKNNNVSLPTAENKTTPR